MAVFGPQVLGKLYLGVLVLGICSSEGSSVTPIYDTDPETRLEEVVRYVGEKPQVLAKAIDILAPEVPGLAEAFQPVPNPGNVSALCDGCLVSTALSHIYAYILYDDRHTACRGRYIALYIERCMDVQPRIYQHQ